MLSWKKNRKILICVSGGIAAYKIPELVRGFIKTDCQVQVMLSKAAEEFVSPMVLSTLSHNRTWLEEDFLSKEQGWNIPHITTSDWADIILVAPATANRIASIAHGMAQSVIDATVLASKCPVVIFPAMNVNMLYNPATQNNIQTLKANGYEIVDPDSGDLACGYEGAGRLPSTEAIMEEAYMALCPKKDLTGKKVLITAGPTLEYMDSVRYLSNPSSGKMGIALAKVAKYRGAKVTLILGPVSQPAPSGVEVIPITSALQMFDQVDSRMKDSDIIIKAAAVSDYRFDHIHPSKMKREGRDELTCILIQNPDIAAHVGENRRPGQILIGFAAETNNMEEYAMGKLSRKKLDIIVANDLTAPGAGFAVDTNTVSIYDAHGLMTEAVGSKESVADTILDAAVSKF